MWYIIPSGNPGTSIVKQWGLSTDVPLAPAAPICRDESNQHTPSFV
jgi:hypothetical protein